MQKITSLCTLLTLTLLTSGTTKTWFDPGDLALAIQMREERERFSEYPRSQRQHQTFSGQTIIENDNGTQPNTINNEDATINTPTHTSTDNDTPEN